MLRDSVVLWHVSCCYFSITSRASYCMGRHVPAASLGATCRHTKGNPMSNWHHVRLISVCVDNWRGPGDFGFDCPRTSAGAFAETEQASAMRRLGDWHGTKTGRRAITALLLCEAHGTLCCAATPKQSLCSLPRRSFCNILFCLPDSPSSVKSTIQSTSALVAAQAWILIFNYKQACKGFSWNVVLATAC